MTMRLFLLQPAVVFAARVNQASFTYPIWQVEWDGTSSGSFMNVKENMTVLFGTAPGLADLGRQRTIATAETTTLYFGRSSRGTKDGEVYLTDNAYITVLDDYRVWAKVPYIDSDGTIYKDGLFAYGDHTINIPPKANAGAGFAGTIDPDTEVITVSFSSSESYGLVNAISSVEWDVADGTITVGTSSSTSITATFPAGFRWVRLMVVDSESNFHITAVPVYARDPDDDTSITAFEIDRHTIRKDGQELSLRILSDIPRGTYPDGTLVMLWEDEPEDAADRSHMRFIGWHHTDPAEIVAERTAVLSRVSFDCLDVAGKLRTLPGFPISIEGSATPGSWLEMFEPNMDKYIDYLLRWHSTAFEVAHFTLSGTGSDYPFVILGSDGGTIWEQAARRAQALVPDYILTCDSQGKIAIRPDPIIQDTADRTATVQAALLEAHWSDIRYTHQRPPRVHWLRSEAVLASSSVIAAMFCVAPDDTPGQGTAEQTQGEQLAISQDDLNVCEGNRYARLNAENTYLSITLPTEPDNSIEPADLTWVTLLVSSTTAAQRGLTFAAARGIVHEINITYRHERTGLVKTMTLLWEQETSGLPATTYIPPSTDFNIDYEPLPDSGYDPNPGSIAGDGFGTVYVMDAGHLIRTRNFSASSPEWVDISPTDAEDFNDFILDSWAPRTTGYLISDSGVWKSTNLDQSAPTFSLVLTNAEMVTGASASSVAEVLYIFTSINVENYAAVFFNATVGGENHIYCGRTTDGGDNWSFSAVRTGAGTIDWQGSVDYVPRLVSDEIRIYVMMNAVTNRSRPFMFRSDDSGATWSSFAFPNPSIGQFPVPSSVHVPYSNNASGAIVYVTQGGGSGGAGLFKSTDSGATWSNLDTTPASQFHRRSVETYTQNDQSGFVWRSTLTLETTTDGFGTLDTPALTGLSGTIYACGGFPYQDGQFYAVTSDGIFVTTDGGETWSDKTGDWAAAIAARCVIVPLWVAE